MSHTRRKTPGFTLIELLVVIAIIAVLIALLLPAVQAAREAARRSQCINNFKQMGLALHNYHDTMSSFPIGRMGIGYTYPGSNPVGDPNRRVWFYSVLPYVEQSQVFNAMNFSWSFYQAPNTTVIRLPMTVFQCPSQQPSVQEPDTPYPRGKGSMGANWGNTGFYQNETGRGSGAQGQAGGDPYTGGPMGALGNATNTTAVFFSGAPFKGNASTSLRDMIDGTTNTLLVGEVIMGINTTAGGQGQGVGPYDHRGDIFNDDYNCTMFNTYTTPNSKIFDQHGNNTYCGWKLQNNPPCNNLSPAWNAARSRHPGGVNVLNADGSVKFFKDSINPATWRALGSPAGGEVVSSDSY
jgi:prepilin-type N-terminal cleavage/methylation domain-containing protein/prepilin-type processing-associated H-X9-DG protein